MGKTRDFINNLKGELSAHQFKRIHMKKGSTYEEDRLCRHKMAALDQKYETKIKKMIQTHLKYLDEPDPYGRAPILDAQVKKILFTTLLHRLEKLHGDPFMKALDSEVERLETNPVIDQPRWAPLQFNHIYNFFKSIVHGSKAERENKNEPSAPEKKQK